MASIQKRGKKYAVVYTYDDSKGEKKQKSITALLFRPVN